MSRAAARTRVVRVLPAVPAVDRELDYLLPEGWEGPAEVGSIVRVPLRGRRVGGWIVDTAPEPPQGVELAALHRVSGRGPAPELIELARWAAWRWAGRRAHFLATASPPKVVKALPSPAPAPDVGAPLPEVVSDAFASLGTLIRLAPSLDPLPWVLGAAARLAVAPRRSGPPQGPAIAEPAPPRSVLVLVPEVEVARALAGCLAGAGWPVALLPGAWAAAAGGGRVVIGTRGAAWGPAPGLAAVLVLDAHDAAYRQEQAPTWRAWEVAAERARRAGAPCVLVSPCPTLEMQAWAPLRTLSRASERRGWAVLQVVDRRKEDPRAGLLTEPLVAALRRAQPGPGRPALCVLNRTGRSRLLACGACGEIARCERCGAALVEPARAEAGVALSCGTCGTARPRVCAKCGSGLLKNLRAGVARVREELEAVLGVAVAEVTSASPSAAGTEPVVVGTEAVLHRFASGPLVAFLDFDRELLAPGYEAGERALALLARAARIVGGRDGGGRVLVQTRLGTHEVIVAAVSADPGRLSRAEAPRRQALRQPPYGALAQLSGAGAEEHAGLLRQVALPGVEVLGPVGGRFLVRAPGHQELCDLLGRVPRSRTRLRIEVDPSGV